MNERMNKKTIKFWAYGFLYSMLLGLIEKFVTYKWGGTETWTTNLELFLLPVTYFLLGLLIKVSEEAFKLNILNINTERIRMLSALVYYLHYIIWFFTKKLSH